MSAIINVGLYLEEELLKKLELLADKNNTTFNIFVTDCILKQLDLIKEISIEIVELMQNLRDQTIVLKNGSQIYGDQIFIKLKKAKDILGDHLFNQLIVF